MPPRIVEVRDGILKKNDLLARELRQRFTAAGVTVVSLVSSPGSGKTAFLERTLTALAPSFRVAALVGDLATERDAERLRRSGVPVRPITTGTVCHLDADMVSSALAELDISSLDFLFVENVGNLVCPSSYDLGESLRAVLLSVTEGEDKPLKYPTIFQSADLAIVTKIDLAGAVGFDREEAHRNIQKVRPGLETLETSARTGEGFAPWLEKLDELGGKFFRPSRGSSGRTLIFPGDSVGSDVAGFPRMKSDETLTETPPDRRPDGSAIDPNLRGADESAFRDVLKEMVEVLEEARLPYALIGGLASTGWGRPRWTHDIDVFVRPEDAVPVLEALASRGFVTEKTDATWLFKAFKDRVMVDIIFCSTGGFYLDAEMLDRAAKRDFQGQMVRVVPPEDLLIMKAVVHDERGPRHWHDALGIIMGADLDWDYLERRALRAPRRVLSLLLYAQSIDLTVPPGVIRRLFSRIYD